MKRKKKLFWLAIRVKRGRKQNKKKEGGEEKKNLAEREQQRKKKTGLAIFRQLKSKVGKFREGRRSCPFSLSSKIVSAERAEGYQKLRGFTCFQS